MNLRISFAGRRDAESALREQLLDFAWLMRRGAIYLGVPGLLGVLMLAAAAWLHWVEEPKAERALVALEADIAELKRKSAQPLAETGPSPIEIFRRQLEPEARFSTVLNDVNATLKATNVMLIEAVVTHPKFDALPTIGRIDLALHARGPYPALKASFGKLLGLHPGLGLEQLTLEKTEANNPVLDAHARFVYFFRD